MYIPICRLDDEEVLYAAIEELMKVTKPHDNVIIMGDLNDIIEEPREGKEVGYFDLEKRNARGKRMIKFCRDEALVITHTHTQSRR